MATLCLNEVIAIEPGSIAEELGIPVGARLIEINGRPIQDRLDYWFLSSADDLLLVMQEGAEEVEYAIEKDFDEVLGLVFPDSLMDAAKHCHNHCVFCFIDQLPKGLRQSLYFKDDDSRLSFLHGNFVTLTNLNQADLQRIVDYGIHPINVSIHTMNPVLRRKMLAHPKSGDIAQQLRFLADNHVRMNAQIVLVPGYNTEQELSDTLEKLMPYFPELESIGIVPVGLTKFRERLPHIKPFTRDQARDVIARTASFQAKALTTIGTRLAFLADEFYLKAEVDIPSTEDYEDFVQQENGIGMLRQFTNEVAEAASSSHLLPTRHFVTGDAFYPALKNIVDGLNIQYNGTCKVSRITNHFLGESITVAGLLAGRDIIDQLVVTPGETVVLCETMLNTDGIMLDDMTVPQLEEALECQIQVAPNHGEALLKESVCRNR